MGYTFRLTQRYIFNNFDLFKLLKSALHLSELGYLLIWNFPLHKNIVNYYFYLLLYFLYMFVTNKLRNLKFEFELLLKLNIAY